MLYIIYCTDDPSKSATVRPLHLQEHLAYLEKNKDLIVLGGARLEEDGVTRVGSTLLLNVASIEKARAFSRGEPYTQAGLYARVEIMRMRRAQWCPENAPKSVDGN